MVAAQAKVGEGAGNAAAKVSPRVRYMLDQARTRKTDRPLAACSTCLCIGRTREGIGRTREGFGRAACCAMRFGSEWASPFLAVDWCYRLPPARAVQIYDVKNNRQRNSLYDAEHTQELLKWSRTYLAKKGLTTERQLRVRALCSTDAFRGADASCAITGTNQRTSFT